MKVVKHYEYAYTGPNGTYAVYDEVDVKRNAAGQDNFTLKRSEREQIGNHRTGKGKGIKVTIEAWEGGNR